MYNDEPSWFDWKSCMILFLWLAMFCQIISSAASLTNQIALRERIEKLEQKGTDQ